VRNPTLLHPRSRMGAPGPAPDAARALRRWVHREAHLRRFTDLASVVAAAHNRHPDSSSAGVLRAPLRVATDEPLAGRTVL